MWGIACGDPQASERMDHRPALRAQGAPFGAPDFVVDCEGGGDFTEIQPAIDAAQSGQWIEVAPCTYQERLDFNGHSVFLRAPAGAADTIIDAQGNGPAITATTGETDEAGIQGFTLRRGSGETVLVDMAEFRMSDIVIQEGDGAYGVLADSSNIEIDNLTMVDNDFSTAGVYADRGSMAIKNSDIDCGNGSYGIFTGHGALHLDWSEVSCEGNFNWALFSEHSIGRVLRSSLHGDMEVENEDDHYTDQIQSTDTLHDGDIVVTYGTLTLRNGIVNGSVSLALTTTPVISSTIFVGGSCAIESDVALEPTYNTFFEVDSGCGYGDPEYVGSDGNLDEDPMFVDPLAGDFHLDAGSPLINAGEADPFWEDVDGSRNDMGLYGSRYSQDGGW